RESSGVSPKGSSRTSQEKVMLSPAVMRSVDPEKERSRGPMLVTTPTTAELSSPTVFEYGQGVFDLAVVRDLDRQVGFLDLGQVTGRVDHRSRAVGQGERGPAEVRPREDHRPAGGGVARRRGEGEDLRGTDGDRHRLCLEIAGIVFRPED